jgi:hypothetical protein
VRRLLAIEARRSAMLPMIPVLSGLLLLSPIARHLTPVALWVSRSNDVQSTVQAIGPFVAGVAAWMAFREHRRAATDLLDCTPYPPMRRWLVTWSAIGIWAVLCYLANAGAVFAITAGQATWGRPVAWPVLSGLVSVLTCAVLGFVAGRLLPSRLTAPLLAIAVFVAMAAMMQWALTGGWPGRLSPIYPSIRESPFFQVDPSLAQAQIVCYLGVSAVAVGLLALGTRGVIRPTRRRGGALFAAGVLLVATAAALAYRSPVGDLGGSARATPVSVPVAYTPVCADSPMRICVHPAFRQELPALEAALGPITAPLAGTAAMPTGVAQARPGSADPSMAGADNSGALPFGFGNFTLHGRTITPQQALTALQTRFAFALVTPRPHLNAPAPTGSAQRAVALYLLQQAGDTPEPGLLSPSAADVAGARRLAGMADADRRTWLTEHAAAMRSGRLTLADLP